MTGLSGSGKTTIAREALERLRSTGTLACLLDGDELRDGINSDLGFEKEDRCESLRRAAHTASTVADLGAVVLVAMISPFTEDRNRARGIIGDERFVEVFVKVSLDEAKSRDPKGLYEQAEQGDIRDFTGITDPYEEPRDADVVLDTESLSVEEAVSALMRSIDRPGSG